VDVDNNCSNNIIGGTISGAANIIAYTMAAGFDGVRVRDGCTGILIRGNSIFSNGNATVNGLGIDLGPDGVTPNDSCDTDTGANLRQNFPVLTSAASGPTMTSVSGTLNSTANGIFLLQFYANAGSTVSGYGEGQTYLGSAYVT